METIMACLVGLLFTIGTYLVLSRQMLRIIFGLSIISHAVNLLILTSGGLKTGSAPLLDETMTGFTDPLPQALILTAIVINFAVTALLLVLSYRSYQIFETDDLERLRGNPDE